MSAARQTLVVRLMSVTPAEFARSLAVLDPQAYLDPAGTARVQVAGSRASVHLEVLPERRLGGLLALPQARVSIAFDDGTAGQRQAFLDLFDLAFQRGGG